MAHRRIARLKARFRWRHIAARTAALCTTIRGRILIAFLVLCMITAGLGAYATLGVRNAGLLVDKTFDESLMSINYARAAAADFAAMRAAFARRWIAPDPPMRSALDAEIDKLGKSLAQDLTIAAQRAQSARATRAAQNAVGAVDAWQDISKRLLDGTQLEINWTTLDHYAAKVDEQIDLLVNYTAGDGFLYRQSARAAVARDIKLNIGGIALALLLSGLVAWTLARRIVGPVAVASGVAERIAAGKLDVAVPKGGADELGALLAAMGVMRDNIKAMMDREVAQRRSDRRQAEAKIVHMARHDALTNLPNRVLFRDTMEQALRRGEKLAVLFLDLDRFKSINDTLGHSLGDALLCAVSERLRGIMGGTDAVARLGGDEFAILQANGRPNSTSELAAKVIEALSQPFEVRGHQLIIGTSIGIAMAPADGKDADQLLRNADMALYRAKAEGRGTYHFFQAEMDAQMQERRRLELDLRKALAAEEFELYYQPIIRLDGDDVCGFEALIRWNHPERGFVTPDAFIPLAEEIGLIVPLGEWVLKQACRHAAAWPGDQKVAGQN
jgi:diguanylate cyclase (GGDEF)-like protein